jgi:DNA polymerase-3 subunit delta
MSEQKPVVYILRGDDREAVENHIKKFYASMGSPDMASMNTTRLEGKSITLNDLRDAALSLPFLTDRRMVIVEDFEKIFKGEGKGSQHEDFLGFLDTLPSSTGLVLVAPDFLKYYGGDWVWASLNDKHWLIKWVISAGKRAIIIDCVLPRGTQMQAWIRNRVNELGGRITPQASALLAAYVGSNTLRASQEIEKLLTYVNFQRPVDDDDVRILTMQDREKDIFTLVDAIGHRNAKQALDMLHLLLEENDFIPIYSMIIRQFRLLLQTREVLDAGGSTQEVASNVKVSTYVAGKVVSQAERFSLPALERVYQRLLEIDLDHKTGGMPGDIALELLITRLAEGLIY